MSDLKKESDPWFNETPFSEKFPKVGMAIQSEAAIIKNKQNNLTLFSA